MSKIGIDISQWQGHIGDFNRVAEQIDFAILRVGFGVQYLPSSQKDKQFDNYYAGLYGKKPIGAYYYSYAKNIGDGRKEAENCLRYLGDRDLDLPIFYDVEDNSMNHIEEVTREFVDRIKEAGYKAGVYTYENWTKTKINLANFSDCEIWVASYGTNNGEIQERYKPTFNPLNIWQYTSRGWIDGINGNIDMNIMYSDVPEPGPTPTPPEPHYSGDDNIRNIQNFVNDNYATDIDNDGYYGPKTKWALTKALQHELNVQYGAGLNEDGIFGPATKNACINVRQGAQGNITRLIQSMLYCKGYDTNGVDGIFGSGTNKAVRRFQANQGIGVDGIVGKNTFERLFK